MKKTIKTGDKPYTVGWRKENGKWKPVFTQKRSVKKASKEAARKAWREEQDRISAFEYAIAKDD